MPTTREAALTAIRAAAHQALARVRASATATYHEATHAESKAENKYDTRSLEASYLARGQSERVAELTQAVAFVDTLTSAPREPDQPIGIGTFVCLVDAADRTRWVLVAPVGGGLMASFRETQLGIVTPSAPLGRALLGAEVDDEISLPGGTMFVIEQVD